MRFVYGNNLQGLEEEMKKGLDVNKKYEDYGWTLMLAAAETDQVEIMKYLIKKGADINQVSDGKEVSPLIRAASTNSIKTLKLLLKKKADINYQGKEFGCTALMWASALKKNESAKLLVKKNALLNVRGYRGETALSLATEDENIEIVKLLLNSGANKNLASYIKGKTPLDIAIGHNNKELINLLK